MHTYLSHKSNRQNPPAAAVAVVTVAGNEMGEEIAGGGNRKRNRAIVRILSAGGFNIGQSATKSPTNILVGD